MHISAKSELVERNGKQYLNVFDKPKLDMTTTRMYLRLDNLFNGNKALGETMNTFLNDNWVDLFNELKKGVLEAFGSVIVNLINNVYRRVPYEQLFKPETET